MPDITFPQVDISKAAADLNNAVKEGAYVAVGLGVLGFQRAQVQRVELTKQLEEQLAQLNSQFDTYITTARGQAETARAQLADQLAEISKAVDEALAPARARLAKVLPAEFPTFNEITEQLNGAASQIETQLEQARTQLVELLKTVEERVAPARQQLEGQIDRVEQTLPPAARNVVQSIRSVASTQEHALRSVVGLN